MVGSSNPSRVKLMTYEIDTCRYLAWHLALIGYDKDWLAQNQDNVTEWDIGVIVPVAWSPSGQHDKFMCVSNHKSLPVMI